MFSYSKRLALLLTVCGTLLNSEPLFAPTNLSPAPKTPWYSRWASKLNPFGKKERTPTQYLKAVNKRMRTISNLTDEILTKVKRDNVSLQTVEGRLKLMGNTGKDPNTPLGVLKSKTQEEKSALESNLAQYRKEWETLEKRLGNVYERLETDKQNLHDKNASAHFFKTVDRDLEDADKAINDTKGYIRRAKEAVGRLKSKIPGFRKKKAAAEPNLLEALAVESYVSKHTAKQTQADPVSQKAMPDIENPKGMSAASPEFLAAIERKRMHDLQID